MRMQLKKIRRGKIKKSRNTFHGLRRKQGWKFKKVNARKSFFFLNKGNSVGPNLGKLRSELNLGRLFSLLIKWYKAFFLFRLCGENGTLVFWEFLHFLSAFHQKNKKKKFHQWGFKNNLIIFILTMLRSLHSNT